MNLYDILLYKMRLKWIEASAGCGKTTLLLNEYDKNNKKTLFLTFSNAAAKELNNRVKNKDNIKISTIHSLAYNIILKKFPKKNIIEEKLENHSLALLLKDKNFYDLYYWLIENSDGIIEKVEEDDFFFKKEENYLNITEFNTLFDNKLLDKKVILYFEDIFFTKAKTERKKIKIDIKENDEIKGIYIENVKNRIEKHKKNIQKYAFFIKNKLFCALKLKENELKDKNNLLYYEDLLPECVDLLKSDDFLIFHELGDIKSIYIDESQDLSKEQWEFVYFLLNSSKDFVEDLIIAGDSKQLIYEFQGASIDIFRKFKSKIQKFVDFYEEINMNKTYRLSYNICSFVNKIGKNLDINFKDHESINAEKGEVNIINIAEYDDLIPFIDEKSMILFKQNTYKIKNFAKKLINNGYFLNSSYFIDHPIFKDFQHLLKWLIYKDRLSLGVIANIFKFSNMKYKELLQQESLQKLNSLNFDDLIDLFNNWVIIDEVELFYGEKLQSSKDFYSLLLFKYAEFYRYLPYEAIFDLNNFYKNHVDLFEGGLFLNTIHSSKGREAENVVLLDCDCNTMYNFDTNRLFYVGLTRAKSRLIIPILNDNLKGTWAELIEK